MLVDKGRIVERTVLEVPKKLSIDSAATVEVSEGISMFNNQNNPILAESAPFINSKEKVLIDLQ